MGEKREGRLTYRLCRQHPGVTPVYQHKNVRFRVGRRRSVIAPRALCGMCGKELRMFLVIPGRA